MYSRPRIDNRRILIVDDNRTIHQDIRRILADRDGANDLNDMAAAVFGDTIVSTKVVNLPRYTIDSAYQGEEALRMVTQAVDAGQPYALAFIDMRMPPGWDGAETIKRIWEVDPHIQTVICTAYSDYTWEQLVAMLGVSDRLLIVKKPFDQPELCQLALALTEKWRLVQRAAAKHEVADEDEASRV